jgi:hypothetical protein
MPSHFIALLTTEGGPNPADELNNLVHQCNSDESDHVAWFKSTLTQNDFERSGQSICILFYRLSTGGIEALIARIMPNHGAAPEDVIRFYEIYLNLRQFWRLGGKRALFESPDIVITRFDSLEDIPGVSCASGSKAVETFEYQAAQAFWMFPEGCFPNGITSPLEWLRSFVNV